MTGGHCRPPARGEAAGRRRRPGIMGNLRVSQPIQSAKGPPHGVSLCWFPATEEARWDLFRLDHRSVRFTWITLGLRRRDYALRGEAGAMGGGWAPRHMASRRQTHLHEPRYRPRRHAVRAGKRGRHAPAGGGRFSKRAARTHPCHLERRSRPAAAGFETVGEPERSEPQPRRGPAAGAGRKRRNGFHGRIKRIKVVVSRVLSEERPRPLAEERPRRWSPSCFHPAHDLRRRAHVTNRVQ